MEAWCPRVDRRKHIAKKRKEKASSGLSAERGAKNYADSLSSKLAVLRSVPATSAYPQQSQSSSEQGNRGAAVRYRDGAYNGVIASDKPVSHICRCGSKLRKQIRRRASAEG